MLCCCWVSVDVIACYGVPSCCQYHQYSLRGVVRGREKNSLATIGVFPCVNVCWCM